MRISAYTLLALLMASFSSAFASGGPPVTHYKDGDTILTDTTWQGRIEVDGVVFVVDGVTLTVMPGTVVAFKKHEGSYKEGKASEVLIPGSGIKVEGKIIAEGTLEEGITFTSDEGAPAPGDWGCIFLDRSKGDVFKRCRFEYSTYTLHAHFSSIEVTRCVLTDNEDGSRLGTSKVTFGHCDVTDNTGKGLNFRQCAGSVTNCDITGNQDGVFLNEKDTALRIEGNNIHDNKGMDLRLGESHAEDVTLSGDWWGSGDIADIAKRVYDKEDDPAVGKAAIVPEKTPVIGAGVAGLSVEVKWKFKTGGYVDSSPAVSDGTVYFGSWDKSFYAVKEDTGEKLWSFATGDCVDSSPAVSDGRVVFGSWDRNVYCLDAKDGSLKWKFDMPPSNFDDHRQASPYAARGVVYMGGFNGSLYALGLDDGKPKWESQAGGPIRSRPCVSYRRSGGGLAPMVYAGSDAGVLRALDSGSPGKPLWEFKAGDAANSSPVAAGGKVYFGSRDGSIYCIDEKDGKALWSYKTGGKIEYSSPLPTNSLVIIGSTDGKLYALDRDKGTLAWSFDCGAVIYSSPQLSGDKVVVADNAGHVHFLDAAAGSPVGEFKAGDAVQGLSAGPDGAVYAGSRDGYLYSLTVGK